MKIKLLLAFLILSFSISAQLDEYVMIEAGAKMSTFQSNDFDHFIFSPSLSIEVVQELGGVGGYFIGLTYHQQGTDFSDASNVFSHRIHYVGLYTGGRFSFGNLFVDIGGCVGIDAADDLQYEVGGEDFTKNIEEGPRQFTTNNVFVFGGIGYFIADRKARIGAYYEHGVSNLYTSPSTGLDERSQGITLKAAIRI